MRKKSLKIFILLTTIIGMLTKENDNEIEKLEKKKEEIYVQLGKAINESIQSLQNNNDTEALLGIKYMKQLKNQIQETNVTYEEANQENETNSLLKDPRRNFKYFNEHSFTRPTFSDVKEANMVEIQKRIDEWLQKRQLERQKIKEYKEKLRANDAQYERCPRYGVAKGGKSNKIFSKKRRENDKKRFKYPCCRKCCKKSLLGCL